MAQSSSMQDKVESVASDVADVASTVSDTQSKVEGVVSDVAGFVQQMEVFAARLAAIEQIVSPLVPHVGALGKIAGMADRLAIIIENLARGRVQT